MIYSKLSYIGNNKARTEQEEEDSIVVQVLLILQVYIARDRIIHLRCIRGWRLGLM